ncbi:MAG: DHH family phosphoesterase [Candidatus Thermoplasmatota archaeon]
MHKLEEAKKLLLKADFVNIISHIDADGIASAAIASITLDRIGIQHKVEFLKQLDKVSIENLKEKSLDLLWFTDLGSGSMNLLAEFRNVLITDHHVPSSFNEIDGICHINPFIEGKNCEIEISGAGVTYLLAKYIDERNKELSCLGIVGAVGDLQDSLNSSLVGLNREILAEGIKAGVLEYKKDIRYFGRETRPVYRMLQYSSDPTIFGLTGNEEKCISFLISLGIKLKDGENWRRWIDLEKWEKRAIISRIICNLLSNGIGHETAKRLVGEVYLLKKETLGTELHDAKEFATLLNACGRYNKGNIGLKVCKGDRGEEYKKARLLLAGHRKSLVESLHLIEEIGIEKRNYIQCFFGGDQILDTLVGTLAGMLLYSGKISNTLPILGLAYTDKGVKVSARATRELVSQGLNLSTIMKEVSAKVGGIGGGHAIAAGALIPKGREEEFLKEVEIKVKEQIFHA